MTSQLNRTVVDIIGTGLHVQIKQIIVRINRTTNHASVLLEFCNGIVNRYLRWPVVTYIDSFTTAVIKSTSYVICCSPNYLCVVSNFDFVSAFFFDTWRITQHDRKLSFVGNGWQFCSHLQLKRRLLWPVKTYNVLYNKLIFIESIAGKTIGYSYWFV